MIFIARVKGDPLQVSCSEPGCGASWSIPEEEVARLMASGDVVTRVTPQQGWSSMQTVAVCASCQDKFKAAAKARRRSGRHGVDQEHDDLRHLIAQTRQAHPDWELERVVHECVEYLASPEFESNPAFRAYLMDRAEHES